MKFKKKNYFKVIKRVVHNSLAVDANSVSCIIVYQPKAPAALKKFKKFENDK